MGRKIRFRGISKCRGEHWIYGDLVHKRNGDVYINNPIFGGTDVENESIGEFTGKMDKNKIEIFSGDLLKDQDGVIYEVWYSEDTAAFMAEMINPANDMVDILGGYDTERCFEVIGNIYDNKDVLKRLKDK